MKNIKQHIGKQLWYLVEKNLKYIVESNATTQLCNDVREKSYHKMKDEISSKAIIRVVHI